MSLVPRWESGLAWGGVEFGGDVDAHHWWTNNSTVLVHLGSIHSGTRRENLCPDVYHSALSFETVTEKLQKTLGYDGYPPGENEAQDWNRIGGPADPVRFINNYPSKQCGHPSGSPPDELYTYSGSAYLSASQLPTVEIRVYAFNTGNANYAARFDEWCPPIPGYTTYACALPEPYYYNMTSANPLCSLCIPHHDAYWAWIAIRDSSLTYTDAWRRQILNHEVGHVLGLSDCDGCGPNSIMHTTTGASWPVDIDRDVDPDYVIKSVDNVARTATDVGD